MKAPRSLLAAPLFLLVGVTPVPADPDCSGKGRWPANMALVHLKNAQVVMLDELDPTQTKATRVASEQIGDDLYRQVHHVTFVRKSGGEIEVLTVNDASSSECSMGAVSVFVIGQRLGG